MDSAGIKRIGIPNDGAGIEIPLKMLYSDVKRVASGIKYLFDIIHAHTPKFISDVAGIVFYLLLLLMHITSLAGTSIYWYTVLHKEQ